MCSILLYAGIETLILGKSPRLLFFLTILHNRLNLIGKKYIKGLEELEVVLRSKDELYATLKNTEDLNSQITLKELKYPVKKGDTIGVIKYFTETGQVIGSVDVISANDIDNASLVTKIKMIFAD